MKTKEEIVKENFTAIVIRRYHGYLGLFIYKGDDIVLEVDSEFQELRIDFLNRIIKNQIIDEKYKRAINEYLNQ